MITKSSSLAVSLVMAALLLAGLLALLGGWGRNLSPVYAQGTHRYVSSDGSNSGTCSEAASPCRTIQYAIDQAGAGDVVLIAGGVYTPNGAQAVADIAKNLTVRGGYTTTDNFAVSDPIASPTLVDAEGVARGVYIHNSGVNVALENLRITGGDAAGLSANSGYGGGVLVSNGIFDNNAVAVITNCVIYENTAHSSGDGYGGGVAIYRHATAHISNSQILSNTATAGASSSGYGGGIASNNFTTLNLSNSLVRNNLASARTGSGGGIYLKGYPSLIRDNHILSNTASTGYGGYGGGVHVEDGSTLEANTVQYNRVTESGTWGQGGGICLRFPNSAVARRNLVQGNQAPYGGGISYEDEDAVLDGNIILDNTASDRGGGLYIVASGTASFNLDNLVIAGNAGGSGAGIYLASGRPTFRHLTLVNNSGGDGLGLYIALHGSQKIGATLRSSIIADQTTGIYISSGEEANVYDTLWHNVGTRNTGSGDFTDNNPLSGNPLFVDPSGGDFHITEDSAAKDLCADTGLDHDFENHPRPGGDGPDCGADEVFESGIVLTKQACRSMVGLDETFTYNLELSVTALDVHNLMLTDTLDTFQQPVAMTASQGNCILYDPGWGGRAVCDVGTVANGESVAFTLTVRTTTVSPFSVPQILTNTAIARGDGVEAEAEASLELQTCRARLVEGSNETIFTSVQAAIDAASYITSEVQIAGGCYDVETRNGHTQIIYLDKSLTLRGGYSLDFAAWDPAAYPSILDGRQQGRVMYLTGAGIMPTIEALRLTGGVGENIGTLSGEMYNTGGYYAGGGLYAGPDVQAVISNCHIYENRGLDGSSYLGSDRCGMGGGIILQGAAVILRKNHIYNNVASTPQCGASGIEYGYGGGTALVSSDNAVLEGNTFYDNISLQGACAQGFGGGVFLLNSDARVLTNTLTGNIAGTETVYACDGGGLMVDGGAPLIQGNLMVANIASQGWEGRGGGMLLKGSQAQVDFNIFQDNIAASQGGSGYGGGAGLYNGDQSTLSSNTFLNNAANAGSGDGMGGGVRIFNSGPVILTGNLMQGNCAAKAYDGRGGGIAVDEDSHAVLSRNTIQQNWGSLYDWGAGGGVYIESDSTAVLDQNLILTNTAGYTASGALPGSGGGMALVEAGTVEMTNNTLQGNIACPAGAGRGGGLYVQGSVAVTLDHNIIIANTASAGGTGQGGGMCLAFESALAAMDNTWQDNIAATGDNGDFGDYGYGGGLYLDESALTTTRDTWLDNTASVVGVAYGGGLYVDDGDLIMYDSVVLSNTTGSGDMSGHGYGGGLYSTGNAVVTAARTMFVSNTAFEAGGGLYLRGDNLLFTNTLIARNHAGWEGAGVSIKSPSQFMHATIADNTGAEGVYVSEEALFSNSIIAGHTIGLYADDRAELEGILWHDNETDKVRDWGIILADDEYWGDPRFAGPDHNDYHLSAGSAAIDRAEYSPVIDDLDGRARPFGGGVELGAYETHAGFTFSPGYDAYITPGEPVTFTHMLRNNSAAADVYTLTWTTDRGWSTLLTATPVAVNAGEAVTVQLRATAPDGIAYGIYETVYLTATSHTTPALVAAPINRLRAGLGGTASLTPAYSRTVMAGETVVYTHTLVNNTNVDQTFSLTGESSEWYDVTISPSTTDPLPAFGGVALITVTIETSMWEISGTVDATIVTAAGSLGSVAIVTDLTTIIEPDNYPPSADAGTDQTVAAGDMVTLDGSGSSDPDGNTLTYLWQQTGGAPQVTFTPNLSITTFTAPSAATVLTFTLTVTDTGGLADQDDMVVTVQTYSIYLPLVMRQ